MKIIINVLLLLTVFLVLTSAPEAAQQPAGKAAPPSVSAGWNSMLAAAKREGKVTLYAEMGPGLRAALSKAIKDKFDIEMEVVPGRALEVAQKFLAENQSNVHQADILMLGQTTTVALLKPKGVLAPIRPLLVLPEVTDPKAWKEGKVPFLDKDELAIPLIASYRSFLVRNSEMVSEKEIRSYQDLLQPQWKGKVVFNDPTATGSGATWVAFMHKILGADEGAKYLRQFALLEPVITRDPRFQVESVAKGKYPLGLGASSQVVSDFQKVQAPLEWAKVKEGGIVIPGSAVLSMPQKPAHANAARVVLNWLLTQQGQAVFVKGFGHPARRADVSTEDVVDPSVIPHEGAKLFWLDEEFILQESALMPLSREIFGSLMK